ncbi:MAG: hypothetical protein HGB12_03855 [Bacteroidetes bacterium]|nr:hypothetical protein [Bacteroidota bacterium]
MKTHKLQKSNKIISYIVFGMLVLNFQLLNLNSFAQNGGVAVNASGSAADNSAMLDISATNQGMRIPRVALTDTSVAGPITNPVNSLLVFDSAAAVFPNYITPGFYYWDASRTQWVSLLSSNSVSTSTSGWALTGNANTTAGTNFVGSTNSVDVVIKSNNIEALRAETDGNIKISRQIYTPKHIIP